MQGRSWCSKRRVGCAAEGMVFRVGCTVGLSGSMVSTVGFIVVHEILMLIIKSWLC